MWGAAQTVQIAYRQRMFFRFVWAQAYLRSPTHAFGLFKRCLATLRGASSSAAAAATGLDPAPGGMAMPAAARNAEPPAPAGDDVVVVSSIDAWPERPGFCLALTHHAHAVDPVFLGYVRWRRRRESSSSSGSTSGRGAPAVATTTIPATPAAAEGSSPAQHEPPPAPPPPLPLPLPQQQQLQDTPPPDPEGARLFEKKHPIRTAAVRSMLADLRVPFLPGALDSAMEDLERTIAREGAGAGSAAAAAAARSGRPPGIAVSGGRPVGGGGRLGPPQGVPGISFAAWYGWWVRHLPFDPASTGCLLKTVRCAKALHAAEVSAAAGK